MKTSELLGGFKVVNFENLEDEELERPEGKHSDVMRKCNCTLIVTALAYRVNYFAGAMQRLWEDIIPEADRREIEEEEEAKRMKELNLGPRERKQIQNVNCFSFLFLTIYFSSPLIRTHKIKHRFVFLVG